VVCCAPPGLALLITLALPEGAPGTPTATAIALHNLVFAAGMFLVAIIGASTGSAWVRTRADAAWLWVPVLGAGAVVGHAAAMPIVVLLAALIEELVFRRSVPELLARNLGRAWWHRGRAVLLAQASFAGAHFTGRPVDEWGDGLPFLRLVTAGMLLATIYASAGLLSAAAVHAFINDCMRTGRFGPFVAPGIEVTALIALGTMVMLAIQAKHGARGRRIEGGIADFGGLRPLPGQRIRSIRDIASRPVMRGFPDGDHTA
jgi:membrane protease YdiL (CAAX protease family)